MPSKATTAEGKFLVPRDDKLSRTCEEKQSKALVVRGTKNTEPHKSTSRALVLRKTAYGSGEIAVSRKISGQEKLSLLAGEMMTTSVRAPFRIDELLKMAESQLGVHMDEIFNLKDPAFFYDDILTTIDSRIESAPDRNGIRNPPTQDTRWVSLAVGSRIHNVYLLAGSWRIVRNLLKELGMMGLDDADVHTQLKTNEKLRTRYLVLYDIVTMLATVGQQRVANIAAATPHYRSYFVRKDKSGHDAEMEFDHHGNSPRKIREAHKSYIDAILLELVLPDSQHPPYILMSLLQNAVEECRKEEKRFSQTLWDAVGDFSVTVQVLDLVEVPLLGPEGEAWIKNTGPSNGYIEFLRVEALSHKACQQVDAWKDFLKPLIDTKKPHVLAQLWYNVNKSYQQVSGVGIDTHWSLQSDFQRSPQWSTYVIPGLTFDEDSDPDGRTLVLHKRAKGNKPDRKNHLQIEDISDDDEMPDLMTMSDSSVERDPASESDDNDLLSEGDSESDYNPDEDEFLQDMLREALDAAIDIDLLEHDPESQENNSSNPFTRMFACLKNRYFSANPTLRAKERGRNPFKSRPAGVASSSTVTPRSAPKLTKLDSQTKRNNKLDLPPLTPMRPLNEEPNLMRTKISVQNTFTSEEELPPLVLPGTPTSRKSQKTTIEEVEDDDTQPKKQKKKKKKKKTKKAQETSGSSQPLPMAQQPIPGFSTPSKPSEGSPAKQSLLQSPIKTLRDDMDANVSRTSLPLTRETTAQSAHAYMQSAHITTEKKKVKTRPAFAGNFFKSDKELKKPLDNAAEKVGLLGRMKKIHLPKRVSSLMSRLIGPAEDKMHAKKSMKWEEFLKVMQAMGFSYNPSTAGSSVRFDPPNPKDPPITFHKPHPDPTLQKHHLRDFGKRLKRNYGWREEQFDNFGVRKEDNND